MTALQLDKVELAGRPLNGWGLRKIAEAHADYEAATAAIAALPYVSTE